MGSLFKKPRHSNDSGRNGFDLSQRRIFSAPCGMMLPAFADYAVAGDTYNLNSESFVRTEAVETAAFVKLRYHVDWHFVPMEQLYMFWNEYYNQTQHVETSFVNLNSSVDYSFPKHNLRSVFHSVMVSGPGNFFGREYENGADYIFYCDVFGTPLAWNFRRLWDMFDLGSISSTSFTSTGGFYSLLLKYLAYHKVFYSHYNNTVFFKNENSLYSMDAYHGKEVPQALTSSIMSTIHYRPYNIDYFTNIQPAPTFNSAFVNSALSKDIYDISDINLDAVNPGSKITNAQSQEIAALDKASGGIYLNEPSGSANAVNFGVGDIRTLFALDKLYRITATAGSSYEEQTYAHLGFKVPQGIKKDSYFIGSQVTDIDINEVVATASTGVDNAGGVLGDIAGKGFGLTRGQDNLKFTAPADGVLLAIVSISPLPMYASRCCDVLNRYSDPFDFFHPEFDNIGMVPMYNASQYFNDLTGINGLDISGWTYRYSELKTRYDVVNESIWDTYRSSWAGFKQSLYGDLKDNPSSNVYPSLESLFFVAPQYTNSIFLLNYPYFNPVSSVKDSQPVTPAENYGWSNPFLSSTNVYSGDNFIVNSYFKVFKTSIMSVHSLPKLY
ncbi:major capsid protein [Sigmofec virus UA08Rod_4124]|uniref:Major capsid protein n=1 Tax=Sigmofec virus UA08Rod_4124 TaxID=2929395 RepID=A0A976N1G9_9VIRU|nr:major capsid protein [Sigmofec virus UA08Rod_4124]